MSFLLQRLAPIFENEVKLFTWVREDLVHRKESLELIRAFLRDADGLQERDEELKIRVKQVRDVVHETEDLLDELELLQKHNHTDGFSVSLRKISCCIRNMKARYRIASGLRDMDCRMKNIFSDHRRFLTRYDTASNSSNPGTTDCHYY